MHQLEACAHCAKSDYVSRGICPSYDKTRFVVCSVLQQYAIMVVALVVVVALGVRVGLRGGTASPSSITKLEYQVAPEVFSTRGFV